MDNQQVPKADSEFQKIVRKNYKKWKIRLLSGGGQKASSGGGPYKIKPDYKMGKSAPPGLEESEQLDEVIRKKGGKYCLFSKKTKKNLGCYPTRAGAVKREKQVQYFKHMSEDMPANNVGGGAIAGLGVGPDGEPGVKKKKNKLPSFISYIRRNDKK